MKNIIKFMMLVVVLGFTINGFTQNESFVVQYQEDESPTLIFKNEFDEDVVIYWYAGDNATNKVTVGSTANTLDCSGTDDTIAEIKALFEAVTNSSGKKLLYVDGNCSLAADSTDDETLDDATGGVGTRIKPGRWSESAVLWDTSTAKFYGAYVPNSHDSPSGDQGSKVVNCLFGNIGGTGDITLNVYRDGSEVYEKVIETPVFYRSQDATWVTNEINAAQLDSFIELKNFNFPIEKGNDYLLRATRATTATTGSIGCTVTPGK